MLVASGKQRNLGTVDDCWTGGLVVMYTPSICGNRVGHLPADQSYAGPVLVRQLE